MDQNKKLTPLEMVAREMAEHSSLEEHVIADAITRHLSATRKRAADAIMNDMESIEAMQLTAEYQAIAEMVLFFGSQLIAFEDIDADESYGPAN